MRKRTSNLQRASPNDCSLGENSICSTIYGKQVLVVLGCRFLTSWGSVIWGEIVSDSLVFAIRYICLDLTVICSKFTDVWVSDADGQAVPCQA